MLPRSQYVRGLVVSFLLMRLYRQAVAQSGRCEEGWLFFRETQLFNSGMCYLPVRGPASHPEAKQFCQSRVSYLIDLDRIDQFILANANPSLQQFLFNNLSDVFWSGMYVSPRTGRLMWHEFGPKYVDSRDRFSNKPWGWKNGIPNISNTCGKVVLGKRFTTSGVNSTTSAPNIVHNGVVEVELVSCSERLPFVCGKPAIQPFLDRIDICPDQWLGNPELPYCIRWENRWSTYSMAVQRCDQLGGQLATINDNENGRNTSVLEYAQSYYDRFEESFSGIGFEFEVTSWVQGNIRKESPGCLSVDFRTETARFQNISCQLESYFFCTRNIIYPKKPSIAVDSVYFDKEAMTGIYPWTPLPLYAEFHRVPLANQVIFLTTPIGILNSTNNFQFPLFSNVRYDVRTSSRQSTLPPYYVNVTLPLIVVPSRKRRSSVYNDRVKRQVSPDFGFGLTNGLLGETAFPPDWGYIVQTCGYYSFGQFTLDPPRYVETDPVLMRYDESQLYIYLAKFGIRSWLFQETISPADILYWKLTKDLDFISIIYQLMSITNITSQSGISEDPTDVANNFLYFRTEVDDITLSPSQITLRVFLIPRPAIGVVSDSEQSYLPLIETFIRRELGGNDGFDASLLKVFSTVACPKMIEYIESLDQNVTIPSMLIGQSGYSWKRCYQGNGALASAVCTGDYQKGAVWGSLALNTGCQAFPELTNSTSTDDLKTLSETEITNDNVENVLKETANLTRPEVNLTEADVIYTAEILYKALKFDGIIPVDLEDVFDVTNNIIQTNPEAIYTATELNNAANRIIRSVDELTNAFEPRSYNDSLRIVRPFVASAVQVQTGNSDIVIGLELESSAENQISDSSLMSLKTESDVNLKNTSTAIYLPEDLIKGARTKLAFHLYTKTELFTVPQGRFQVNSNVAAARLEKNKRPVYDLEQYRVTIIFEIKEFSEYQVCGFWDYSANEDAGGWKTEGCAIAKKVNESKIICECDHLTNFAVLIDINAHELSDTHKVVLGIVTKIGLAVSIVGLALTILTFLLFKHLRNGRGQQVLVNLSVAMLCSAVVFLVGMDRVENVTGCKVVAILLHYFILVSFAWMLVEGVLQYLRFVKVLGTYIPRFMMKTMIPAWGIPLIPVIFVLAINHDLYFGGKGYCWLDVDAMLYAFIIPVAVILFANIVVFILILRNLLMRSNKMKTNQSERKMALLHFRAAVSVFVVLGLTWIFGFLALSGAQIVFSYVFAVLNAFQGLFIFLLFTAREKQIRKAWKKLCCRKAPYKSDTSGTDSHPRKLHSGTAGISSGSKTTSSNGHTSSTDGLTSSANGPATSPDVYTSLADGRASPADEYTSLSDRRDSSTNEYMPSTNGVVSSTNSNSQQPAHFINPQYSAQL